MEPGRELWVEVRRKSLLLGLAVSYFGWGFITVVGAALTSMVRFLPYGRALESAVWVFLVAVGGAVVSTLEFLVSFPARWGSGPKGRYASLLALLSVVSWFVLMQLPSFFSDYLAPTIFVVCMSVGNAMNHAYSKLFKAPGHKTQLLVSALLALSSPIPLILSPLGSAFSWTVSTVLVGAEYIGVANYLYSKAFRSGG